MRTLRERVYWCLIGALFFATAMTWYAIIREDRAGVLTVSFFNVGQGDAIYIESPTGNQVLIDGGPDKTVLRGLGGIVPFYDRTIDLLIVSNPDQDHIAGLIDVLGAYRVNRLFEPGTVGKSAAYRVLTEAVVREGVERILARRGMQVRLDRGVTLEILFPDRDAVDLPSNEGSIVGKLVYGNTSFLFPGDAPEGIENYLAVLDGKRLDVDVLKVGHHGSKTSTGEALLGLTSPQFAVISAGKENRYGHPHREVLERLARFGITPLSTAERGTITFSSDGHHVWLR